MKSKAWLNIVENLLKKNIEPHQNFTGFYIKDVEALDGLQDP